MSFTTKRRPRELLLELVAAGYRGISIAPKTSLILLKHHDSSCFFRKFAACMALSLLIMTKNAYVRPTQI